MITVDIESEAIEFGSPLLPKPVGISIKERGKEGIYLAFGHPEGNTCTWEDAKRVVSHFWSGPIITHNGATFDIPVLQHWFELPERDPLLTHDTLFLAYLHNPHARSLSLKDLAVDWLGMDKNEQDELHDWIVMNVPECRGRKGAGAYIAKAPGGLVGRYANADTAMTERLFDHLHEIVTETMLEPYQRELRLAPILVEIQNRGIRCEAGRLEEDYRTAMTKLHKLDAEVRRELNAPELNPGSNKELGAVLKAQGYTGFLSTAKGAMSVGKDSLDKALANAPNLHKLLRDRNTLATLTGTFMGPWLEIAHKNSGFIHAQYNQVRNPEGYGTRTGRLSSSNPNFQNVPGDLGGEYPEMRSYLLPDEGQVWTCGDFKSQEPRLTAHFEDGALCEAFNENPDLDPYLFVVDVLSGSVKRKEAKAILLGLIYSQGVALLAEKLECEQSYASTMRNIIKGALPDVVELDKTCKRRFETGLAIKTLGGRFYFCEPPANGRSWAYKALNTLIQGSAADQTKEALIFAHKEFRLLDRSIRLLGTVHDEFSVSHPEEHKKNVYEIMQLAANALPCDVPMRMDIFTGDRWSSAEE